MGVLGKWSLTSCNCMQIQCMPTISQGERLELSLVSQSIHEAQKIKEHPIQGTSSYTCGKFSGRARRCLAKGQVEKVGTFGVEGEQRRKRFVGDAVV